LTLSRCPAKRENPAEAGGPLRHLQEFRHTAVQSSGGTGSIARFSHRKTPAQSRFFSPRRAFISGPQTLRGPERLRKGGGGLEWASFWRWTSRPGVCAPHDPTLADHSVRRPGHRRPRRGRTGRKDLPRFDRDPAGVAGPRNRVVRSAFTDGSRDRLWETALASGASRQRARSLALRAARLPSSRGERDAHVSPLGRTLVARAKCACGRAAAG
jgi:hypothetical protein